MSKAPLFCITFILCTFNCFTQQARFGADMGISMAQGSYEPHENIDRRIMGGFDGGFLAEIPTTSNLKIQPEAGFTIDGVELNNGSQERTIKLFYTTLAIISKWKVIPRLNILAGVKNCFLLSAWNDPTGGGHSTQIKGNFKFSDILIVLGAEYFITDYLFLSARYNHGMEQIVEDGLGYEIKNRYASLRIGYIFSRK